MNLKIKLRTMLIGSISIAAVAFPTISFPQVSAPAPVKLSSPVSVPIQTYIPPVLTMPIKIDPPAVIQLPVPDFSILNNVTKKWAEERERQSYPQTFVPAIPSYTPSVGYQPYQPPLKFDSDTSEAILKALNTAPANTFNPNYKVDAAQIKKQKCIKQNRSLLFPYDCKGNFNR
jgi:hypothetical protein